MVTVGVGAPEGEAVVEGGKDRVGVGVAPAEPVAGAEREGTEAVGGADQEWEAESLGEPEPLRLPQAVDEAEALRLRGGEGEEEGVGARTLPLVVAVREGVLLGEAQGEGEELSLGEPEGPGEREGEREADGEPGSERVGVGVGVGARLPDALSEGRVAVAETEAAAEAEGAPGEGVAKGEPDRLPLALGLGEAEVLPGALALGGCEREPEAEQLVEREALGQGVGRTLPETLPVALALREATRGEGEGEALALRERVGEPVPDRELLPEALAWLAVALDEVDMLTLPLLLGLAVARSAEADSWGEGVAGALALGVEQGEGPLEGEPVGVGVLAPPPGETEGDSEARAVADSEAVVEAQGEVEGEPEAQGEEEGEGGALRL